MFRKLFSNPSSAVADSPYFNPAAEAARESLGIKPPDCGGCINKFKAYEEMYEANGLSLGKVRDVFMDLEGCFYCRDQLNEDINYFIDELILTINKKGYVYDTREEAIATLVSDATSRRIKTISDYYYYEFIKLFIRYDKRVHPETYNTTKLKNEIERMKQAEKYNPPFTENKSLDTRNLEDRINLYDKLFKSKLRK